MKSGCLVVGCALILIGAIATVTGELAIAWSWFLAASLGLIGLIGVVSAAISITDRG